MHEIFVRGGESICKIMRFDDMIVGVDLDGQHTSLLTLSAIFMDLK